MNEAVIRLENVHKHYGSVHALRGVDLEVSAGEIFGFLGPNGAGKTTAIRCMLDFIRPNRGEIHIFGMNAQHEPEAVKAKIGYLPGDLKMEGDFTARAYLEYLRSLRNAENSRQTIVELAERLSLPLDQKIETLSQGNKQKVGLIQSLMSKAPLLLLDEPTLGLDPLIQQEVLSLVREANNNGATVFFSSHILSEVQNISSRVGIIRQGVLVEIADTKDLINRSVTQAVIHFLDPVDPAVFTKDIHCRLLRVSDDSRAMTVEVEGDMDEFIKTIAQHHVREIEIHRPSLEEIFLKYYRGNESEAA